MNATGYVLQLVSRVSAAALQLAAILITGCGSNAMPGTALGTFSIEASTTSNSCGDGVDATSPWDFDVELSRDSSKLYWRKDGVTSSGTLSSSGQATITGGTSAEVVAADAGSTGCTMSRDDTITISIGTASTVTSGSGNLAYTFSVDSGSDCSSQLAANGGEYDKLPCDLNYSFTGTRTKAP